MTAYLSVWIHKQILKNKKNQCLAPYDSSPAEVFLIRLNTRFDTLSKKEQCLCSKAEHSVSLNTMTTLRNVPSHNKETEQEPRNSVSLCYAVDSLISDSDWSPIVKTKSNKAVNRSSVSTRQPSARSTATCYVNKGQLRPQVKKTITVTDMN